MYEKHIKITLLKTIISLARILQNKVVIAA